MESVKKCSSREHLEINAINYCPKCEIYMCNKCEKIHSNLCPNHQSYNIEQNIKDIYTGFCKEERHSQFPLDYFCKTHNTLCCAACIAKIKEKGNGQHKDCEICIIENIKNEKKNKLKENIKNIEELSNNLIQSINELKIIYEKINESKEELKSNIQKIFTKIRNALNDREEELLLEVDNCYFNEDIIKKSEKLPDKIKKALEKGNNITDNEWNDNNKLSLLINMCINVENNINEINIINENIKKCNKNKKFNIKFKPNESGINSFIEKIKIFGNISNNNFRFKECPKEANEAHKYIVSGENNNILTHNGKDGYWVIITCEEILEKSKEYKWKIKILNTKNKSIMVGVAPIDFDINKSYWTTCGWYLYCYNSSLYSGPPYNYNGIKTNLSGVKDEVEVIMDMNNKTLKFIINNEDKGVSYTNIPIDKPISPAIGFYNKNDSVEITKC